ncbi:uncharacterized protein LOC135396571 isoform X3 [Ornithodoros turicata]|uniref:uncharacterized protein LOC135396571 isoform X3 n=1 Tax=Ornithodoros turicata TaxID=34597 RepID=UPI00313942E9
MVLAAVVVCSVLCLVQKSPNVYVVRRVHASENKMKPSTVTPPFAIVHFVLRNEVEVIPCSWLSGNTCMWPNLPSHKVEKLIRKGCPPGSSCQELEVEVKGIFKCYEDARKMLPVSEYTSDLVDELPPKRIRRPKVFESSSDDDFPSVPPSFAAREKLLPKRTPVHAVTLDSEPSTLVDHRDSSVTGTHREHCPGPADFEEYSELEGASFRTGCAGDSPPITCNQRSSQVPQRQLHTEPAHSGARTLPAASTTTRSQTQAMPDCEFQRQVLKSLNILRMAMQQHSELLSSLVPQQSSLVEAPLLLSEPLDSVEDVDNFERQLTPDRQKQLVTELMLLGGSSLKCAVKRILSHMFTDKLAQLYSWEGRKGKFKFVDLTLPGLILRALHAQKKFSKVTEFEVQVVAKEWLRHAGDRCKRAKSIESAVA